MSAQLPARSSVHTIPYNNDWRVSRRLSRGIHLPPTYSHASSAPVTLLPPPASFYSQHVTRTSPRSPLIVTPGNCAFVQSPLRRVHKALCACACVTVSAAFTGELTSVQRN